MLRKRRITLTPWETSGARREWTYPAVADELLTGSSVLWEDNGGAQVVARYPDDRWIYMSVFGYAMGNAFWKSLRWWSSTAELEKYLTRRILSGEGNKNTREVLRALLLWKEDEESAAESAAEAAEEAAIDGTEA